VHRKEKLTPKIEALWRHPDNGQPGLSNHLILSKVNMLKLPRLPKVTSILSASYLFSATALKKV